MTRGQRSSTAHLVADNADEARAQWVEMFGRDGADLGPAHAAESAAEAIDPQPGATVGPDDPAASRSTGSPGTAGVSDALQRDRSMTSRENSSAEVIARRPLPALS